MTSENNQAAGADCCLLCLSSGLIAVNDVLTPPQESRAVQIRCVLCFYLEAAHTLSRMYIYVLSYRYAQYSAQDSSYHRRNAEAALLSVDYQLSGSYLRAHRLEIERGLKGREVFRQST